MKVKIIISLFLLTTLCVAPAFAQERSRDKVLRESGWWRNCDQINSGKKFLNKTEPLCTEFMQLKNLDIRITPFCLTATIDEKTRDENSLKFVNFVKRFLSEKGEVEVESRSNTIIITDIESRIKIVSDFVKLLDESGFTLEEIVNNPNLEIK